MGFEPGPGITEPGRGGARPNEDPMLVVEAGAGTRRSRVRWEFFAFFGFAEGLEGVHLAPRTGAASPNITR